MFRQYIIRSSISVLSIVLLIWIYTALLVRTSDDLGIYQSNQVQVNRVNTGSGKPTIKREYVNYGLDDSQNPPDLSASNKALLTSNIPDRSTSESRLPSTIIIGVKKCGTRALLEYLRLHPQVRAPGPEPHFFDRYYNKGLEWYRHKMPPSSPDQITIEKTPRYFVTSEVPARIYNMSRNVKLLLVVRDPVIRAISDFTQAVSKNMYNNNVTFKMKALENSGDVSTRWSAISTGLYAKHLAKWLDYFNIKDMHFVSGEQLIHDPISELNAVQDFLGLTRYIDRTMIYFNSTRGFPCIRKPNVPKCFRNTKGREHITTDNDTLYKLYEFYHPHNEYFYKMTNRKFDWTPTR